MPGNVPQGITLSEIVDLIILIGALCGAIYKIWDFFAKPTSKLKQKIQKRKEAQILAVLNKELPQRFYDHDLETRDKYKSDRENYLNEIKNEVIKTVGGTITQNSTDLEALKISASDVLREKIMAIYHKNKQTRELSEYEREALVQYYKDYKALNGNSYIDKRYERMKRWTIVYDEMLDDE